MGALAGLLKQAGHEVRGSDTALYPPMSEQLARLGIEIAEGFRAENLDWGPDHVVVGNVCPPDHVEVVAAQERGLPLTSMPAVLEDHFLPEHQSLVVVGTHGKTTTSSLMAQVLLDAERDPSFLIGGVPISVGQGWRLGGGREFLIEGDEYDSAFFDKGSKFLHYRPDIAVLTSVELDHVDIFSSMDAVRDTFRKFVQLVPEEGLLIVAASSPEAVTIAEQHARCRIETYAFGKRAADVDNVTWYGHNVERLRGGRCRFDVVRNGEPFAHIETNLFGAHNHENILATIAMANAIGIAPEVVRRSLSGFAGVRRRQEVRGIAQGTFVLDDYAHHPTAVAETLKGLRKRFNGRRIVAVYEPRSATSRRKTFQREFVTAFSHADHVIVGKLFSPDRIPEEERFNPAKLALELHRKGTTASHIDNTEGIVAHISGLVRPGDVVVVFSSGTFDGLHDKLLGALGDAVIPGTPSDMAGVRELLDANGLDWRDLREGDHKNFLVVRNESGLVGCVGLEIYGEDAILRSLAVRSDARGQGYGWMLADNQVSYARHRGVRRIYLLTPETASDFFAEKLGFRVVDVSTVAPAIAASTTFQSKGKGARTMRLDL